MLLPDDDVLCNEQRLVCELEGVKTRVEEVVDSERWVRKDCGRGVDPYGWALAKS